MGDDNITPILVVGRVKSELLSSKCLELDGVYHVLDVKKNLISASLLIQLGYEVLFASNKVVITRDDTFVCKGYLTGDGLFKLNVVITEVNNVVNSLLFVSNVKSFNSSHSRPGDVNL